MHDQLLPAHSALTRNVANALAFQLGWFACVLGGDAVALPVTVGLLVLHRGLTGANGREWWFIAIVGMVGLIADSLFGAAGVLRFDNPSLGWMPAWLLCLWLLFATTLCHALGWLRQRLLLAGVLGAVSGPSSYLAGSRLADVALLQPDLLALGMLSLFWGLLFPALLLLSRKLRC